MKEKNYIVKKRPFWLRLVLYTLGMIFLALGISLTTKINLGVSPIVSIAYAISEIFKLKFSGVVFGLYGTFIIIQVVIHVLGKNMKRIMIDLGQMIVNLAFSGILEFMGSGLMLIANSNYGFIFSNNFSRGIVLIISIVLTGVGAAMCLSMRLIPNPGDGIVQTISDVSKRPLGTVKNIFDLTCVLITIVISYFFKGRIIGIGIGTIVTMLGVGRVIAAYQKITENSWLLRQESD